MESLIRSIVMFGAIVRREYLIDEERVPLLQNNFIVEIYIHICIYKSIYIYIYIFRRSLLHCPVLVRLRFKHRGSHTFGEVREVVEIYRLNKFVIGSKYFVDLCGFLWSVHKNFGYHNGSAF